jgi:hypothetical protein
MMQPPCPINSDIRLALTDPLGGANRSACADGAEFEDAFECGAVFTSEAAGAVAGQGFGGLGHDGFEEVDVFVCVEAGELGFGGADGAL